LLEEFGIPLRKRRNSLIDQHEVVGAAGEETAAIGDLQLAGDLPATLDQLGRDVAEITTPRGSDSSAPKPIRPSPHPRSSSVPAPLSSAPASTRSRIGANNANARSWHSSSPE
jgi:hypothetical protein